MAGPAERRQVTLIRDGDRIATFDVDPEQSILEATDATEVGMEYGCRDGSCVRCIARLLEGEVTHEVEPRALTSEQRDTGFILLCIAHPGTDCRLEIGRTVLEDAFPELWRRESGFR